MNSIALVIGYAIIFGGVAFFSFVFGSWIYSRLFSKNKIADKYIKKKDNVHHMYCDEDGIKWGDVWP